MADRNLFSDYLGSFQARNLALVNQIPGHGIGLVGMEHDRHPFPFHRYDGIRVFSLTWMCCPGLDTTVFPETGVPEASPGWEERPLFPSLFQATYQKPIRPVYEFGFFNIAKKRIGFLRLNRFH